MLPDDVLLEIFDLYMDEDFIEGCSDEHNEFLKGVIEEWQTLVHVCRRWRSIVFGSPRRLNLRLVCTQKTPARDMLDVWPSLPLLIGNHYSQTEEVDEILSVLERSDRVADIDLIKVDVLKWENVLAAMQVPFPELTHLAYSSRMEPVLPDSFLGGSTPHLRSLMLDGIPFPGLLKLLLSTTHLVTLRLMEIPHSGYFSPKAIVAVLSTLTSLEEFFLGFKSPLSRPDWENRRLLPPTRSVLPVLTYFRFKGVCEYLEDIVTRIDAPRLNDLHITLFNQIVFDTPQFIQFISRLPALETFEKAFFYFGDDNACINLGSLQTPGYGGFDVGVSCIELDWQVSSMEQVCTSCLPPLSTLEDLYIFKLPYWLPVWLDNIENTLWLELFQSFPAVKNLYLSKDFAQAIVPALRELIGGSATEVLPALQNIFLEELQPSGTVHDGIQQFVAMRQVTSHPIAVSRWDDLKGDTGTNIRRLFY
jgi:hypothetical protein